jgi:hypothetical protein
MMQDSKLPQLSIAPSWLEDNQQRETDYQDWLDRSGTERQNDLAQDGRQHLMAQRLSYADWQAEQQREAVRPDGAGKGLDRHDFYNLDTAYELEDAMQRAAAQGIDYGKPDQFQRFLDKEAEAGVGQVEGRRSLSDRHQELRQQSQEAASLTERGARAEQIPAVKLYESAQEQQFRVEQERSVHGQERSPARERLAEIRQQHGIAETDRTAEREPSRGRSR